MNTCMPSVQSHGPRELWYPPVQGCSTGVPFANQYSTRDMVILRTPEAMLTDSHMILGQR